MIKTEVKPGLTTATKAELVAGDDVKPLLPRNVEEAFRMAQLIIKAGLAPASYSDKSGSPDPQMVVAGIMKGMELGFPPMTALATIAIINQRACVWGDGAMALVSRSNELESYKDYFTGTQGEDDWTAVCELRRKGVADTVVRKFSVADAKRAKLWAHPKKRPWTEYPQRMLAARARSWAIRDLFADKLSGLSIAEEAQDLPIKDITPPDTGFLDDEPKQIEASAEYTGSATLSGDAEPAQEPQEPEPEAPDTPQPQEAPETPPEPAETAGEQLQADLHDQSEWQAWASDTIGRIMAMKDPKTIEKKLAESEKLIHCKNIHPTAYERVMGAARAKVKQLEEQNDPTT
ncbi:MAG: hypothetical protein GY906_24140 [bacterium]|nr:hypothetical protein [bacterium]